jgi:hypothetical protein
MPRTFKTTIARSPILRGELIGLRPEHCSRPRVWAGVDAFFAGVEAAIRVAAPRRVGLKRGAGSCVSF